MAIEELRNLLGSRNDTAYIDLMAFAKGAETANQANWQDTFNDIKARDSEAELQQKEFERGITNPLLGLNANETFNTKIANLDEATDFATVLSAASKLPPEEQTAYLLSENKRRLDELLSNPTAPGMKYRLNALGTSLNATAQRFLAEGNTQGALETYAVNPLADPKIRQQAYGQLWSDPAYFSNPEKITGAGGQLQEDGSVLFGGVKLSLPQFAELQRNKSFQPVTTNVPGVLGSVDQKNREVAAGSALADQIKALGYDVTVDPNTGKPTLLPTAKAGNPLKLPYQPATQQARDVLNAFRPEPQDIPPVNATVPTSAVQSQPTPRPAGLAQPAALEMPAYPVQTQRLVDAYQRAGFGVKVDANTGNVVPTGPAVQTAQPQVQTIDAQVLRYLQGLQQTAQPQGAPRTFNPQAVRAPAPAAAVTGRWATR